MFLLQWPRAFERETALAEVSRRVGLLCCGHQGFARQRRSVRLVSDGDIKHLTNKQHIAQPRCRKHQIVECQRP